jgi:hypothetical protein
MIEMGVVVGGRVYEVHSKDWGFRSGDIEDRYRDDIVQQHILNVIDRQREIFQQDNARLHTAMETMDFL